MPIQRCVDCPAESPPEGSSSQAAPPKVPRASHYLLDRDSFLCKVWPASVKITQISLAPRGESRRMSARVDEADQVAMLAVTKLGIVRGHHQRRPWTRFYWRALGDSNPCYRRERDVRLCIPVHASFCNLTKCRYILRFLCIPVYACAPLFSPVYWTSVGHGSLKAEGRR
jgi:hypothetical protein